MNSIARFRLTTLVAVALGAMVLGMVLTGGLGVTPEGSAERLSTAAPAPAAAEAPAPRQGTPISRRSPSG